MSKILKSSTDKSAPKISDANTKISIVLDANIISDSPSIKISNPTSSNPEPDLEHYKELIFDFDNDIDDRINAFLIWQTKPNKNHFIQSTILL